MKKKIISEKVKIFFSPSGKQAKINKGQNLLTISRELGVDIDSICGGRAMCGKCQIEVSEGSFPKLNINSLETNLSKKNSLELNYFTKRKVKQRRRLACQCSVLGDVVIDVPSTSQLHTQLIRKEADNREIELVPPIKLCYIEVKQPNMDDPSGDLTRVKEALILHWNYRIKGELNCDLKVLQSLQSILRKSDWKITVALRYGNQIVAVWPGLKNDVLGVSIDVGSTSLSAVVCNLDNGSVISSKGVMNPQIKFGEDLMSRVSYIFLNNGGLNEMKNAIINAIQKLIEDSITETDYQIDDILELVIVGNPVMHHILLGINPTQLGEAPFALAIESSYQILATEIGLNFHDGTRIYFLPCIAGHVGADASSVVLAEAPYKKKKISLIIDVGTNAEIILGNNDFMLAASSPTGPAFEGAQISAGQRAAPGAIERVRIDPVTYETIFSVVGSNLWSNNKNFQDEIKKTGITGICGSGIIEAIGEMFLAGIIKSDGSINGDLQNSTKKVKKDGRTYKFEICKNVIIYQNDIRAIQLAKAALNAGFKLLMKKAKVTDVNKVILAGAFGSHIDPKYAMILGIVPDCNLENVIAAGNSAGTGARMALLNINYRKEIEDVVTKIEKIETAIEKDFQDFFVDAMAFPHKSDEYNNLKNQVDFSKTIISSKGTNKSKKRRRKKL